MKFFIKDNKYQIIIFSILIIILGGLLIININKKTNEETIEIFNDLEFENQKSVDEEEMNYIYVYVAGEVKNPGVVELLEGDRVENAIEKAGGITQNANIRNINLAKIVEDGEKIYIPNQNENIEIIDTEKSSVKININRATVTELQSLTGIGPTMAAKIVEYRQDNGNFKSIEDIKNVSGIGESKFKEIKDYITV